MKSMNKKGQTMVAETHSPHSLWCCFFSNKKNKQMGRREGKDRHIFGSKHPGKDNDETLR